MITEYQQRLRERYLTAPVMPAPAPWKPVPDGGIAVGGLLGIGFAAHPDTGHDLVMVVSSAGHGLFDAVTGEKIARDRDPDPDTSTPDAHPDLTCPGLGPLAGVPVRIAGLFGGGLHTTTPDGWTMDVVNPDWPHDRVVLSADGGAYKGPAGGTWWHVHHSVHSELRTAGFSPSGRTLAVATSSDLTLWARPELPAPGLTD
ncbi:hypothetical protein [Streptomyces clavuligerus]|nr:hypothetical protein [Streptomyces clavuligerus]ANW22609.1 hypothetical protein BB341_30350 [Streptomyces clavuligerus]AXU16922.1 hypothetical protein D1794_29660 [Streptomyces clavuligerus]EDY53362.1 conserved hypothetical protein [Streptomyces clavuligerus]MBY6306811.1 hypothetical protein [Streptomyces clavuligerus]QCS10589.1 hypothetical protein CRV15_34225 [Streptomyces clavuligerus]